MIRDSGLPVPSLWLASKLELSRRACRCTETFAFGIPHQLHVLVVSLGYEEVYVKVEEVPLSRQDVAVTKLLNGA